MSDKDPPATSEDFRRQALLDRCSQEYGFSADFLKWSITSLQILNGGAIVALVGNDTISDRLFAGAGWCFAGGLLCSLLCGVFMGHYYEVTSSAMLDRLWKGDHLGDETFGEIYLAKVPISVVIASLFGIVSFLLFIIGCWLVS